MQYNFLEIQCQKKEFSAKKGNSISANFLDFKILKFSYDLSTVFIASVCFSDFSVCYNYAVNTL